MIAKTFGVILALGWLCGASFAADAVQDSESVTVTGNQAKALTADLDPTNAHFNGLTGDKISRDIDPLDRQSAFTAFAQGLTGPLMTDYDWYGLRDKGRFRPTREYQEAGLLCRDFTEETDHQRSKQNDKNGGTSQIDTPPPVVMGAACREGDGWHFR